VAGEVGEHRCPRVAEAAEDPGGDALQSIEQLEDRRHEQQRRAERQHGFVRREQAD
jgi:hypothetical protein